MSKYMRVMNGLKSHANGFEYKLNEVNVANNWNPSLESPEEMGGFNFSNEENILRWLLRGDTLYDVEVPSDAEVILCKNPSTPNGVFRSNKIIVSNPREITEDVVMDLYLKSKLPEKTYFQCLKFLSFRNYTEVCKQIIRDKVNDDNIDFAISTFLEFLEVKDDEDHGFYKEVLNILQEIKNKEVINLFIDRVPLIKELTSDNVINLTGQSGSGKSYFARNYNEDYLVVDTDDVFSEHRFKVATGINKELGEFFRNKYEVLPNLGDDFDLIYQEILKYCKKYDKVIVIDCAQFHCIKDISLLKGKIIIIRTCIDTCYKRCIDRFKTNKPNVTSEELSKYEERKKSIYKWYKYSNKFIEKIIELK